MKYPCQINGRYVYKISLDDTIIWSYFTLPNFSLRYFWILHKATWISNVFFLFLNSYSQKMSSYFQMITKKRVGNQFSSFYYIYEMYVEIKIDPFQYWFVILVDFYWSPSACLSFSSFSPSLILSNHIIDVLYRRWPLFLFRYLNLYQHLHHHPSSQRKRKQEAFYHSQKKMEIIGHDMIDAYWLTAFGLVESAWEWITLDVFLSLANVFVVVFVDFYSTFQKPVLFFITFIVWLCSDIFTSIIFIHFLHRREKSKLNW